MNKGIKIILISLGIIGGVLLLYFLFQLLGLMALTTGLDFADHPSDTKMIEQFNTQRSQFEKLLQLTINNDTSTEYTSLCHQLKLEDRCTEQHDDGDQKSVRIAFIDSDKGGMLLGSTKGYVWIADPVWYLGDCKGEHCRVIENDTESLWPHKESGNFFTYRKFDDHWYLLFSDYEY